SDAFTRAFGFNMQSEQGLKVIKTILNEIDTTYKHLPYFHIGADEVQIDNKDFIPEVEKLLHKQGKQTIGWHPGGNYGPETIRQLWKAQQITNDKVRYIDSRALYLNHIDPLAGVASIFERQICDVKQGSNYRRGGASGVWNDGRVAND